MKPLYEEEKPGSGVFTLENEDHTLGNAIRSKLITNMDVIFAGYRIPHPLENKMKITIRTNNRTTPIEAYNQAIDSLLMECESMASSLATSI